MNLLLLVGGLGMANVRNEWLDIAKGIAIILVVIGHSAAFDVTPIYWFHMPAFFIISGYLFKSQDSIQSIKEWVRKRARQLFIPYLFFLILITTLRYSILFFQTEITLDWLIDDLISVAVGGRFFPSDFYVVMWFIPCMFLTQLLFVLIHFHFKSNMMRFVIILLFYCLSHLETWFAADHTIFVPWNIDVALLALSYYAFGYLLKRIFIFSKKNIHFRKLLMFSVIGGAVFIFTLRSQIAYIFDMRSVTYHHLFLDLIIPITLTLLLFSLCILITKFGQLSNILSYIGKSSLIIMYTHVPIKIIYEEAIEPNHYLIVLLGLILPLLFTKFRLEKNSYTSLLVLGRGNSPVRI
jgi:polysaccharide biosynthesis protein PslL